MPDKKTILLIDDEVDMVTMLDGFLNAEGYHVLKAYDGVQGLQQIKEHMPHLIVLDLNMPRMGGISFYHEICGALDGKPAYPVLVLTARANMEKVFRELNVDGFMTKPYDIDDLLKEIRIILGKRYGGQPKMDETTPPDEVEGEGLEKRVLIVEDDKAASEKIAMAFIGQGCQVSVARSGASGMERAMKDVPDLMLLKFGLKDMTGDVIATKLKQMPKTMDIPLLVYSGSKETRLDHTVSEQLSEKIGAEHFIDSDNPKHLLERCREIGQAAKRRRLPRRA